MSHSVDPSPRSPSDDADGGDIAAALFSAIDWEAHPLGPRERWPTALKAMLAFMLASSELMYLVLGDDHSFFFNDAYAPILGARRDTAMGARFEEVWSGDVYAAVAPTFQAALAGRSGRVVDMPIAIARWGVPEDTWWTFSFSPVFDDDGAVAGALCICNETTASILQDAAERRADAALQASERSLHRAQEAGRIGVFAIEMECGTLSGTPEFFRLLGLPPATTMDVSSIENLALPGDAAILSADPRASRDIDPNVEYRVRRPDTGEIRYIERRAEFEYGDDGSVMRMVGVVQDVTDRRRDRDALAKLNATLEATVVERTQALLLHENIIQSDTTAICAFDTEYRLIAFNQAHNDEFFRVNGFYTKLGDVFYDLFVPEQRDVMKAQMARALTGESFTVEEEFGDPAIDAPRWEILYSPLRDPDGKVIGAFHHARDISVRLRAQSELETAREALRQSQKVEAMGQLTGGVAHDFNNLLTPIMISLDQIRRKSDLSEREVRLIDAGLQSAERAKTLVQRLLAFARRQPLRPGAVDLVDLVRGMAELVTRTSGPQIRVVTDLPDGLPSALADANQLEMAILNLCVNARDAMPDGGVITIAVRREPPISCDPAPTSEFLRLSVTDTGVGMNEDIVSRAVEPFFSTKGIGEGTGLGLSMVHGLASQLGGSMHITSRPGEGTRIDLLLPISGAVVVVAPRAPDAPLAPHFTGRALIVDDEPLVRMATADMLENLGYQTIEAAGGDEAERILARGDSIDLVVTDHMMPGMLGAELASMIRRKWPKIPVLIMSGYADVGGISPDLPRLTKPFREADLVDAIRQARRH